MARPPSPPTSLIKSGEFKPGELADMSKVNEGVERVRRAIRREGYMEVRVSADRKMDDEKKTVNVTIHVPPGPQFTMGKLNLTGLDLNSEAEVRRIWILKEGKPFNPEYPGPVPPPHPRAGHCSTISRRRKPSIS